MFFWRDRTGHEIDLLIENTNLLYPVEIKSGATFSGDWIAPLRKLSALFGDEALPPWVIYGGDAEYQRDGCGVMGWARLAG